MAADKTHVLIGNIPENFHSADLRAFFSQIIESRGFHCFHYRHRPENRLLTTREQHDTSVKSQDQVRTNEQLSDEVRTKDSNSFNERKITSSTASVQGNSSRCCIAIVDKSGLSTLIRKYRGKAWVCRNGNYHARRTVISLIKVMDSQRGESSQKGMLIDEKTDDSKSCLTIDDLNKLPELNPPHIMPNGNVGTPLSVYMELIRNCSFPARFISKLDLRFPKSRSNKKYGAIGYDYSKAEVVDLHDRIDADDDNLASGERIDEEQALNFEQKTSEENLEEYDQDNDVEEWDRYEALHDDVDKQGRTQERLFENEIELKWEKGGSGLVFYTDANYWKEQEGDFDEQTVDDWDVDYNGYYEYDGGDKDASDIIQMAIEKRRRDGIEDTSLAAIDGIGEFEKHTKGFGGRILRRQGWKAGSGIGLMENSITKPIDTPGQNPQCKKGIGYYGEKLVRTVKKKKKDKNFAISTVYDNIEEEPQDTVYRSAGPFTLKYRHVNFVSASRSSQAS